VHRFNKNNTETFLFYWHHVHIGQAIMGCQCFIRYIAGEYDSFLQGILPDDRVEALFFLSHAANHQVI
jgi:hypothetical protein